MVASTTGAGATTKLRPADQKAIFGLVANALAITTSSNSAPVSCTGPWPRVAAYHWSPSWPPFKCHHLVQHCALLYTHVLLNYCWPSSQTACSPCTSSPWCRGPMSWPSQPCAAVCCRSAPYLWPSLQQKHSVIITNKLRSGLFPGASGGRRLHQAAALSPTAAATQLAAVQGPIFGVLSAAGAAMVVGEMPTVISGGTVRAP